LNILAFIKIVVVYFYLLLFYQLFNSGTNRIVMEKVFTRGTVDMFPAVVIVSTSVHSNNEVNNYDKELKSTRTDNLMNKVRNYGRGRPPKLLL